MLINIYLNFISHANKPKKVRFWTIDDIAKFTKDREKKKFSLLLELPAQSYRSSRLSTRSYKYRPYRGKEDFF